LHQEVNLQTLDFRWFLYFWVVFYCYVIVSYPLPCHFSLYRRIFSLFQALCLVSISWLVLKDSSLISRLPTVLLCRTGQADCAQVYDKVSTSLSLSTSHCCATLRYHVSYFFSKFDHNRLIVVNHCILDRCDLALRCAIAFAWYVSCSNNIHFPDR
jgi:hypothetical protein